MSDDHRLLDDATFKQLVAPEAVAKGLAITRHWGLRSLARLQWSVRAEIRAIAKTNAVHSIATSLSAANFLRVSHCDCPAFAPLQPCEHVAAAVIAAFAIRPMSEQNANGDQRAITDATLLQFHDQLGGEAFDAELDVALANSPNVVVHTRWNRPPTAQSSGLLLGPPSGPPTDSPNKVVVPKRANPDTERFERIVSDAAAFIEAAAARSDELGRFVELLLQELRARRRPEQSPFPASVAPTLSVTDAVAQLGDAMLVFDDWRAQGLVLLCDSRRYYGEGLAPLPLKPQTYPQQTASRHAFAMLEALIEAALDTRHPLAAPLREAVALHPDDRTLAALTALTEEEKAPAQPTVLSWRINTEGRTWVMTPYEHKLLKRGGWSAGTPFSAYSAAKPTLELLPADEIALARQPRAAAMLHALAGHPRVCFDDAPQRYYQVQRAEPTLTTVENKDGRYAVELKVGGLPIEGDSERADSDFAVTRDVDAHVIYVARLDATARALLKAQRRRELLVSKDNVGKLVSALIPFEAKLPTEHAPALRGTEQAAQDALVARFAFEAGTYALYLLIEPLGAGLAVQPGRGVLNLSRTVNGERIYTQRDPGHERALALEVWHALGLEMASDGGLETPEFAERAMTTERALDLLLAAQALIAARTVDAPSLRIEWPKQQTPRFGTFGSFAQLKIRAGSGVDWLGQESHVAVDKQQVALATVLDAVREGARYVELSDGSFLQIAAELREQLHALDVARQLRQQGGGAFAAALALEQLEELGAEIDFGKELRALIERIRSARSEQPKLPRTLKATLRPYQRDGFEWLMQLSAWGIGGVLADDMGLGKTVQTIALLLARKSLGPALVVAPTSVCGNWQRELERFAPSLRARHATDPAVDSADVVIASYGWLARNAKQLANTRYATAVFDEAQALKNPQAQRTQAARELSAELKIAVTGTPIENRLSELWSLFRIVAPGLLGSQEAFASRFALPIEQRQDPLAKKTLGMIVAPFILRRKKEVVAQELPDKTVIDVAVELGEQEQRLYETLRVAKIEALRNDKNPLTAQQRRIRLLAALTELRLAANHPRFAHADSVIPSSKLAELLRLVAELKDNGHRALVFSQFPSFLAYVTAALEQASVSYQYLDGQTSKPLREERIRAFESGHGDVFVLSLLAGGTGINLTSADYVIILDPWWNPAVEDQAIGRAHRIGQTLPVTVYRLFSRGTIEEKIIGMQVSKRELANAVLENASSAPRSVSADELFSLLAV